MVYRLVKGKKQSTIDNLTVFSGTEKDVSVVIPTFNERQNIPLLIEKINKVVNGHNIEIIVVDDNSKDGTSEIIDDYAKKSNVVALHRIGPRGVFSAQMDGVKIARGKNVVLMDADFSHPPEKIPEMLKDMDDHDLVSCSRFKKGGGIAAPFSRKISTILLNATIKIILNSRLTDFSGVFHAINRDKLREVGFKYDAGWGEFDIELLYRAQLRGFKLKEIPFVYKFRDRDESKSDFLLKYGYTYLMRAIKLRLFK